MTTEHAPKTTPPSAFDKFFDFQNRETALYASWEKANLFKPEANPNPKAETFCMTMPPPNANGELHLGHTSGYSVMDSVTRYQRARGKRVLLVAGKDHAGIQTQVVFEKKLKSEGVNLSSLSRETLYKMCYDFCIDRSQFMRRQEKRIGVSADWDREVFTLDPKVSEVVFDTFKKLWDDGLVYRGKRIVNWSVASQTSISDVEVEYREQKGSLWSIRYPWKTSAGALGAPTRVVDESRVIAGSHDEKILLLGAGEKLPIGERLQGEKIYQVFATNTLGSSVAEWKKSLEALKFDTQTSLRLLKKIEDFQLKTPGPVSLAILLVESDLSAGVVVATTRPETMLGDTAVTVHPQDPRFTKLVGKELIVPLVNRTIKIVADDRVDPFFGTGAVKTTPAHDFLDYSIGETHKLEVLQVIGEDGKMTAVAGKAYEGMPVDDCRAKVVLDLEASGFLIETRPHTHKVPISERAKDVVQPLISEQWFLAVDHPKKSLKKDALAVLRSDALKIYPERFRVEFENWLVNLNDWNISRQLWWGHRIPVWYKGSGTSKETKVGTTSPGEGWVQETDTFDTWFSSGQWPFSTLSSLGMLDLSNTTKSPYFPTHCMQMGRDILMFWACRMLLLGVYRTGTTPWSSIFFTGLIRDEKGDKMSKSKGNGVMPDVMMEKYGTDALRFAIMIGTTPGNDINFGEKKISGYAKFITKVWNAAKFIERRFAGVEAPRTPPTKLALASSQWILGELNSTIKSVTEHMDDFRLAQALEDLYQFTWSTFCDWYLEMLKSRALKDDKVQAEVAWVTATTYRSILAMLHPFIPYVTEEIYQKLSLVSGEKFLVQVGWPTEVQSTQNKDSITAIKKACETISALRHVKASLGTPAERVRAALEPAPIGEFELLIGDMAQVDLVSLSAFEQVQKVRKPLEDNGTALVETTNVEVYRAKIQKDILEAEKTAEVIEKKLSSDFAKFAEPALVRLEQERLSKTRLRLAELGKDLAAVKG